MTKPAYGDILHHNIPVVKEAGSTIKVIAGEYKTTKGAFTGKYVAPCFLDIELAKGASWELEVPLSHTLFVYILEGSVDFAGTKVAIKQVALFEKGDTLQAKAGEGGARFLLFHAEPIGEPIAWGGPIVMNTEAELQQAFAEIQADTFISHD
jgi:redox-sensitive bicupin YhaK (pirin superfamily)